LGVSPNSISSTPKSGGQGVDSYTGLLSIKRGYEWESRV
jgi:hypothetical protein